MNKNSVQNSLSRFTESELDLINRAEELATAAHEGQKRKSGGPYIEHPAAVARTLADWDMDAVTIAAGWLHDTVEDTAITIEQLKSQFGWEVAEIVDGVTKLGKVSKVPGLAESSRHEASSENLRKLLLAMTKDLRVIIVKLADRRHNLLTLKYLNAEKQKRIATESLEIYAPLADRLGMGQLKAELEDLSFRYVDPDGYRHIERLMQGYAKKSQRYLGRLKRFLGRELAAAGINPGSIEGRQKHLYSVYKKLAKTEGDIDKIYDLMAIRIIVPEISDCYRTLGVLHKNFKPLIYRIKDYIAVPKPNGYQSLHTTVFALDGRITEIQIRTPEMHEEAERGLAAHFFYNAQKTSRHYIKRRTVQLPSKYTWVNKLVDLHAGTSSGHDFVEALKIDLFQDRIFVFSPKGDLYDLPEGSTPVDFAFAVHSDVGLRAMGARVNGRMVPLNTQLANRDVVEILTRKQPGPSRDWLGWVKTPHARSRIRAWFRAVSRESNVASGKAALEQEIKAWGYKHLEEVGETKLNMLPEQAHYKDLGSLLAAVGEGSLSVAQVMRKLFPPAIAARPKAHPKVSRQIGTGRVLVAEESGLPYMLAACCNPAFPQPLVGYITRGSGVTVHLRGCRNIPDESERLVKCSWEVAGEADERLIVPLEVLALNRIGLLRDLTGAVAGFNVNISGLASVPQRDDEEVMIRMRVEVSDLYKLAGVMRRLEELPEVLSVSRTSEL